jgi:hypothetical protein
VSLPLSTIAIPCQTKAVGSSSLKIMGPEVFRYQESPSERVYH